MKLEEIKKKIRKEITTLRGEIEQIESERNEECSIFFDILCQKDDIFEKCFSKVTKKHMELASKYSKIEQRKKRLRELYQILAPDTYEFNLEEEAKALGVI